jgi:hypothetical protein
MKKKMTAPANAKRSHKKKMAAPGGLAASVAATKAAEVVEPVTEKPAKATGKGSKPRFKLFGFSVGAAIRGAGENGVTFEQAKAYLEKVGFKGSDITIKSSIQAGKTKRQAGAKLTDEQLVEIKGE